jgi:hypothetical protein
MTGLADREDLPHFSYLPNPVLSELYGEGYWLRYLFNRGFVRGSVEYDFMTC